MVSTPQPHEASGNYVWGLFISERGPARSPAHPALPDGFKKLFSTELWNRLAELHRTIAPNRTIVLTSNDAEASATLQYQMLEPLAPVVVAVTYADWDASVVADAPLWDSHGEQLTALLDGTLARIRSGQVFEALEFAITAGGDLRDLDEGA